MWPFKSGAPKSAPAKVGSDLENVSDSFTIKIISPAWKKEEEIDYFNIDWDEFGNRINHSFGNDNFDVGVLSGAIKQDWQNEEEHLSSFRDWFHNRMDTMIDDAIGQKDGEYFIKDEFINKSANEAMCYQLAFMLRHARQLFSDQQVAKISDIVSQFINSNNIKLILTFLREFGDLKEVLPRSGRTEVKSDDYLVLEMLRGLPKRRENSSRYTQEQIDKAQALVKSLIQERFRLKLTHN